MIPPRRRTALFVPAAHPRALVSVGGRMAERMHLEAATGLLAEAASLGIEP